MKHNATVYLVIRDGRIKLRLAGPNRVWPGPDGKLINSKGCRIVDAEAARSDGNLDAITAHAKACRYDLIDAKYLASVGRSPSGLLVIDEAEYEADRRAAADAAMTPGERAWRDEVAPLIDRAEDLARSDYYDAGAICQARNAARSAVASWRDAYPSDACRRDADRVRDRAAHKHELAVGALTYDADGLMSPNAQQDRYDALMVEAGALTAKAAALEEIR